MTKATSNYFESWRRAKADDDLAAVLESKAQKCDNSVWFFFYYWLANLQPERSEKLGPMRSSQSG